MTLCLISLIAAPIKAASIRYERIRSFGTSEADGASPRGRLFRASDGRLYGTAQHGGILGAGTVFGMNRDGSGFAVLHSFDAARMDGIYPAGGVIEASDGVLYGTTSGGGQTGAGTVFRIAKDGTDYRILHHMGVVDGLGPIARLMEGSDGFLYGTTPDGGSIFSGPGLVFRIDKEGMNYEVLHRFQSGSTSYYTLGGVTECSDGKLYGVTFGESGGQSVYRLNKDGSGFEVVHAFLGEWFPVGEVIEAPDGTLRGILAGNSGHVFRVNKDGTELVRIHSFGLSLHDGTTPTGDLSLGGDGVLYGTTSTGGSNGFGTVFRMDLDGTDYAVLHSFDSSRTNGWAPMASLLEGRDGFLYGSTSPDNNGSGGTLFKLQRDGSAYTHLHSFPVGNGSGPRGSLIQGRDGVLYGTTYQVTPDGVPVAFKINTDGTGYRELTTFAGHRGFVGALLETSAGTLFGTLLSGQLNLLNGAVLQVPRDGGDYSTVQAFFYEFGEGNQAAAPLIEASDLKVYGTTVGGGAQGVGRLFVMNRDGSGFTLLRSFSPIASGPRHPLGALLEARDGWLYGTALAGGSADAGAVFRVSKDGTTFQNVRSFGASGNDGRLPMAGLMEASDGAFYGTTAEGGITDSGTIFKLVADPNWTYMVIHRFGSIEQDGRTPVANVVEGWDGSLYGTCSAGGKFGHGTVFRLDKAGGQYEILHNFGDGPDDGQKIRSGLMLARDGALYGTTWGGGAFGCGTMFRLAPTAALQIDRPYQLSLSGPAGLRWRIEVTTDLGEPASWQALTNVVSGNAPVPINAPEAEFAQRFFRAILTR